MNARDKPIGQIGITASPMRLKVRCEDFQGWADVEGMLQFDGTSLRLDFQTADALLGLLRSGPKELEIPLHSLDGVRCGAGWFWLMPYLEIELNDFKLLTRAPGAKDGRWKLRVHWRDRHSLRRFAAALSFARSSALHTQLNVGLDVDLPSTLPPELPTTEQPQRPPPRQFEG